MNVLSASLARRLAACTRRSTCVSRELFKQSWIHKRRASTTRTPEQMAYVRRLVAPLAPRIQLQLVPGAGVGLASGVHFDQGAEVFSERPLLLAPELEHNSAVCQHCLTPLRTVTQLLAGHGDAHVTDHVTDHVADDVAAIDEQLRHLYQGHYATEHAHCPHCDAHYCSAACQQAAWTEYHQLLCAGDTLTPVKARAALAERSRADSMIAFISRVWAVVAVRYDHVMRNNPALVDQPEHETQTHAFNQAAEHVLNLMAFKFDAATKFSESAWFTERLALIEGALLEAQQSRAVKHVPPMPYDTFVRVYLKLNLNYLTAYSLLAPALLVRDGTVSDLETGLIAPPRLAALRSALYAAMTRAPAALAEALQGSGPALYPLSALLNHHCRPSLTARFGLQGRITWTAARDLPPNTPLTIAYVDPTLTRDERNNYLRTKHYFSCEGCTECD